MHVEPEMKGWLFKWTNYLKGYQRRWFVLSNGLLSYYRNQAEMAHTCRGTISLHGALIHTEESCTFVISNGGTQTFHIKAANEVERQRWVTALELAKAKAIRAIESEDEEESCFEPADAEVSNMVKVLNARLENLETCRELISKHGAALQRSLTELESIDSAVDVSAKIKAVNERATLFRITSNAMINKCGEFLELASQQGRKWQRILIYEREQKRRFQEMVEQLAKDHSLLEQAAKDHRIPRPSNSPLSDEDDETTEFYDAYEGEESCDTEKFVLKINVAKSRKRDTDDASGSSSEVEEMGTMQRDITVVSSSLDLSSRETACERIPSDNKSKVSSNQSSSQKQGEGDSSVVASESQSKKIKRRRIRVPDKPIYPLNLWSIMKNCIGKELSKIPMPVNFSEPLSMLQRLAEDFEYAEVLDKAAQCEDVHEQLAYVAAFTVSSYSTTVNRTGKPFNPLLGETYEFDRTEDLGWRVISEQVSHHPPMVAQHCEGKEWTCWQEFTMASKFRGKYLQVVPLGIAHLKFRQNGQHYTWRKVTTTVHNIIVGKLWVDQHGDFDIINHTNGSKCHLSFIPYSYFTRDVQRKVKGCVMDKDGDVKWVINGTWDSKVDIAPVISVSGTPENPVYKTGEYKMVWRVRPPPSDCDKYYNFTEFACQLNEMEEGVAPTDSRFRPDQRLMEQGEWEEANTVKVKLEEKQRAARRQREAAIAAMASGNMALNYDNNDEQPSDNDDDDDDQAISDSQSEVSGKYYSTYQPIWFDRELDPITGSIAHKYKGGYWEAKERQDWSMCPSIF